MDVVIEKPQELYDEIGRLITVHYKVPGHTSGHGTFAKSYPELYRVYLGMAAEGVRSSKEVPGAPKEPELIAAQPLAGASEEDVAEELNRFKPSDR